MIIEVNKIHFFFIYWFPNPIQEVDSLTLDSGLYQHPPSPGVDTRCGQWTLTILHCTPTVGVKSAPVSVRVVVVVGEPQGDARVVHLDHGGLRLPAAQQRRPHVADIQVLLLHTHVSSSKHV